ncbi:MAG: iron transporter [Sphingomonas bacterium]
MARPEPRSLAYRLAVASRVVAALIGGYGAAAAVAMASARWLPLSRAEAATAATLIAMLALPAAVIWVFAARSAACLGGPIAVIVLAVLAAWAAGGPR